LLIKPVEFTYVAQSLRTVECKKDKNVTRVFSSVHEPVIRRPPCGYFEELQHAMNVLVICTITDVHHRSHFVYLNATVFPNDALIL